VLTLTKRMGPFLRRLGVGWCRGGGRNRTSTHAGASLKAAAIRDAALALTAEGIDTTASLREAVEAAGRLAHHQCGQALPHYPDVDDMTSAHNCRYTDLMLSLPAPPGPRG
jgi:hypothetical protein